MVLCIFGSVRFYIVGAWPVVIFLVVDLFAFWFAFSSTTAGRGLKKLSH